MPDKKEILVVVPVYKSQPNDFEELSFIQSLKVLGDYPFSIITFEGLDVSYYTNLMDEYLISYSVNCFDKDYFKGWASYNRLLLSKGFYETFRRHTYMLIYQLDAFVFKDELQYWCNKGYDYIGAPWFKDFGNGLIQPKLVAVGNGGLSLRKISSALVAFDYMESHDKRISAFNYWNKHLMNRYYKNSLRFIVSRFFGKTNTLRYFQASTINEDAFWSQIVPDAIKTYKVAPIEEAVKFSFESNPAYLFEKNNRQLPFGCHAWHKNQYDSFWVDYINTENK